MDWTGEHPLLASIYQSKTQAAADYFGVSAPVITADMSMEEIQETEDAWRSVYGYTPGEMKDRQFAETLNSVAGTLVTLGAGVILGGLASARGETPRENPVEVVEQSTSPTWSKFLIPVVLLVLAVAIGGRE